MHCAIMKVTCWRYEVKICIFLHLAMSQSFLGDCKYISNSLLPGPSVCCLLQVQMCLVSQRSSSQEVEELQPAAMLEGGKRPKGRPRGSRSKVKVEEQLTPSASAIEGVKKVLTAKKLSDKINYANLDSLFDGVMPHSAPTPR